MKFLALVAILVFIVAVSAYVGNPRPCTVAYKCSFIEEPVWVNNGGKCYGFRNGCLLANTNCQRRNEGLPELKEISRKRCLALCKPGCPENYSPVCGDYLGAQKQFSNQCMMDYEICSTGKTYTLYSNGPCPAPVQPQPPKTCPVIPK